MNPSLLKNDWAWLQKTGVARLQRGDVVIIKSAALGHRIVKRIVGLPGERVRLEESWRVVINGQPLEYRPHPDTTNRLDEAIEGTTHTIQLRRNPKFFYETQQGRDDLKLGPDEYYVLGCIPPRPSFHDPLTIDHRQTLGLSDRPLTRYFVKKGRAGTRHIE